MNMAASTVGRPTSSSDKPKIIVALKKLLQPLVPEFLENRHRDVTLLRDALARGHYEAIRDLGHNLKGLGGAYGVDPITDFSATIEESARAQYGDTIRVTTERLADYLDRIEVVFT